MRWILAAVAAAMLAAPAGAAAQDFGCQGEFPGQAAEPKPGGAPLVFGVYPLGLAGQVGLPASARPEDPARREARLRELSGPSRPFVLHLYVTFRNRPQLEDASRLQLDALDRLTAAGFQAELVLAYRPDGGGSDSDVPAFAAFVRDMVDRLSTNRGLVGLQVTNEANNGTAPDASDGSFGGVRDALIEGVVAAKEEARRLGRSDLRAGFNWFYRMDPSSEDSFWSYLGQHGGQRFVRSLDWVGLDAYPGTFFPPTLPPEGTPGDARDALVNALSALRDCFMREAGIPDSVPIHVTENGFPTGPGRSGEQQEAMLRAMVGAVADYRRNYGVTDYRWFSLRDADSSSPNFQQQYGLLRDDYTPKPAFKAYGDLIARLGSRESPAAGRGRRCVVARAHVGPKGIAGARLGQTRRSAEGRLGPPTRRTRRSERWCVESGGSLRLAFSRRGRVPLVATTAPGHRVRGVGRGVSRRALRRAFRGSARILGGVYRAGRHSRVLFGVTPTRVRFAAVAARSLLRSRPTLREYLRRAGLAKAR